MPGKHPSIAKQTDIQVLLRLLHREMQQSFASTEWFQSLTFAIAQPDSLDRALLEWDGLNRSAHPSKADHNHTEQSSLSKYTSRSQHLSFSSCFWAWWRTQEVPKANPAIAPYLLDRKYLRGRSVEHLPVIQGSCSIPRLLLQDLFDVVDTLKENISYVPNDDVSSQAKGLGTMLSCWERMRNVCPKINCYSGPILNSNNQQCVTSRDLDEAMLETRHFWFDMPIQDDHAWQPVLQVYEKTPRWPPIAPPGRDVCLSKLLYTKGSAPGPDGIPYSAWRVLPEMTLQAMSSYFYDILRTQLFLLPRWASGSQRLKWGPKRITSARWACPIHWTDWWMARLLRI